MNKTQIIEAVEDLDSELREAMVSLDFNNFFVMLDKLQVLFSSAFKNHKIQIRFDNCKYFLTNYIKDKKVLYALSEYRSLRKLVYKQLGIYQEDADQKMVMNTIEETQNLLDSRDLESYGLTFFRLQHLVEWVFDCKLDDTLASHLNVLSDDYSLAEKGNVDSYNNIRRDFARIKKCVYHFTDMKLQKA